MNSWPQITKQFAKKHGLKLTPDEHAKLQKKFCDDWREALSDLPPQRGFDPRPVYSVTLQSVDLESGSNPMAALTLDGKLRKQARKDPNAAGILDTAETVREREIARLAIEHHKAGRVIIAVQPDVANVDDALKALLRSYQQHRRKIKSGKGRWVDWLDVIREFEQDELKGLKGDQVAARYRRIISGFKWSS